MQDNMLRVAKLISTVFLLSGPITALAQEKAYDGSMSCQLAGKTYETSLDSLVRNDFFYRNHSIASTILKLTKGACGDPKFINEYLKAADYEASSLMAEIDGIWLPNAAFRPFEISANPMKAPVSLHLLGYPKALQTAFSTLKKEQEEGNAKAAILLHVLSKERTSTLREIEKAEIADLRELVGSSTFDFRTYSTHFDEFYSPTTPNDPAISQWVNETSSLAGDYLFDAAETTDALAAVHYVQGSSGIFSPCEDFQALRFKKLSNQQGILAEFEAKIDEVLATFHRSLAEPISQYRSAMVLAFGTADILTDCEYAQDVGKPQSFGLLDKRHANAVILGAASLYLKTSSLSSRPTPADFTDKQLARIGLAIEESWDGPSGHYAAGRLFVASLGRATPFFREEHLNAWSKRFSLETIVEAQKVLSEQGLYLSGFDGIVGPAFRGAVAAIECDGGAGKALCLNYEAHKEDWLGPYIHRSD